MREVGMEVSKRQLRRGGWQKGKECIQKHNTSARIRKRRLSMIL